MMKNKNIIKKTALTAFLGLGLFVSAQVKPMQIEQIAPKVYVYQTFNSYKGVDYAANAMFLVTQKGVILFDVPWQKSQYQELLDYFQEKFQLPLIAVFVTHAHEDRAGDLSFFNRKNIPTYATAETNLLLKKEGKATSTHLMEVGKTYRFGGERFVPRFFGEGHTPDNIVIWFPEYKILDGGCLVKSTDAKDMGNTQEANMKEWPLAIKKIQKTYPTAKWVIPGHDDWKTPGTLEKTLELIQIYNESHPQQP